MEAERLSQVAPSIRWEKYTLPNGLQVILAMDTRTPTVSVNLAVPRGLEK